MATISKRGGEASYMLRFHGCASWLVGNVIAIVAVAVLVDWATSYALHQPNALGQYPYWLILVGICRVTGIWFEQYLTTFGKQALILWARGLAVIFSISWYLVPTVTGLVMWRLGIKLPSEPIPQGTALLTALGSTAAVSLLVYLMLYPFCLLAVRPIATHDNRPAPSLVAVTPLNLDVHPLVGHATVWLALVVMSTAYLPQRGVSSTVTLILWAIWYGILRLITIGLERSIYKRGRGMLIRVTRLTTMGIISAALTTYLTLGNFGIATSGSGSTMTASPASFVSIVTGLAFAYSAGYVAVLFVSFLAARLRPVPFKYTQPDSPVDTRRPIQAETASIADWLGPALSLGSLSIVSVNGDVMPILVGIVGGLVLAALIWGRDKMHGRGGSIYTYIGVPLGGADLIVAAFHSSSSLFGFGLVCTGIACVALPYASRLGSQTEVPPGGAPSVAATR